MKPIKISDELKAKALADFTKFMDTTKTIEDKVSFSIDLGKVMNITAVPLIQITADAWLKMCRLISNTDKEIAWHAIVNRADEDVYTISDILVYPQVVSGTAVNTDQLVYETWLQSLDDATFNNLRMQGHSHVNMGTSPSPTDWNLYMEMLAGMTRIPFYLFLIINKRHEMYLLLYDFDRNICFETKDCIWEILLDDGSSLIDWEKNATTVVTTHVAPPIVTNFQSLTRAPVGHATYAEKESQSDSWKRGTFEYSSGRSY